MSKIDLIRQTKQFRKDADDLLQRMKEHTATIKAHQQTTSDEALEDQSEAIAQHILATRDLESTIMRSGMSLKYIGTPNPYPESKNPNSTAVEPTADGLKM